MSPARLAASGAACGDHPDLPKAAGRIGAAPARSAATKRAGALSAEVFARGRGFDAIGLRHGNVFGPRRDPDGAHAAGIPVWLRAARAGEPVWIDRDARTRRDSAPVDTAGLANLPAAQADPGHAPGPGLAAAMPWPMRQRRCG